MILKKLFWLGLLVLFTLPGHGADAPCGWNFDAGLSAEAAARLLVDDVSSRPPAGSWLRIRFPATDPMADSSQAIAERRRALSRLRQIGYRIVALVRWEPTSWSGGTREFRGAHLPRDLRDAFARCRWLAAAYGESVDYWEIDNEPDIGYVPENAETYAAYLKICYLGIAAGLAPTSSNATSHVLMAALAAPPGPYLEAFLRNDALRYTDGFNYHYYGYAEDFSGAYRQFERAIADAIPPGSAFARLHTRFFPSAAGWQSRVLNAFEFPAAVTTAIRAEQLSRPHAAEEPRGRSEGRWVVANGVTVEDSGNAWRFRIAQWPSGITRAPFVELPLPPNWQFRSGSFLTFEYRGQATAAGEGIGALSREAFSATRESPEDKGKAARSDNVRAWEEDVRAERGRHGDRPSKNEMQSLEGRAPRQARGPEPAERAPSRPQRGRHGGRPSNEEVRDEAATEMRAASRELPVFLTEYGYGTLDPVAAVTAAGRERQRRFFASTASQARDLGIEGPLAFLLTPYGERGLQEFGLLMNQPLPGHHESRWGTSFVSPALQRLLESGAQPFTPRRWRVDAAPPAEVVIDFIAGPGIGLAKDYNGYFLELNGGARGELVVYNFGTAPVQGWLELTGDSWKFSDGSRRQHVVIGVQGRVIVPVVVQCHATEFVGADATARFVAEPWSADAAPIVAAAAKESETPPSPPTTPAPPAPVPPQSTGPRSMFACYFRTANGNLYSAGPRLVPAENWQQFLQQAENFTPTTFGRHHLPWRFADNPIVSLVFFFYPVAFPMSVELRSPRVVVFSPPDQPPKPD